MKHAIPQGLEMWLTQKVNSNDSETLLTLSKVHANAYSPVCVCLNNWGFSNITPMLTWKLESNFHVTFKCNLHCCCSVNKSCPTLCNTNSYHTGWHRSKFLPLGMWSPEAASRNLWKVQNLRSYLLNLHFNKISTLDFSY